MASHLSRGTALELKIMLNSGTNETVLFEACRCIYKIGDTIKFKYLAVIFYFVVGFECCKKYVGLADEKDQLYLYDWILIYEFVMK